MNQHAGGFINGGAGVDTLKLAAGTTLNLETLTGNQTVKPIQEVEVVQMQGGSALSLSANDVLSLGGSNASTMSAYSFSATTGGTGSTSSTGKVQMVIHGTSSDTLVLDSLKTDGVTTNSLLGNTGLAGEWLDMGTTTANGATYKVYNHSTSGAQVLVDSAVNVIPENPTTETNVASFSSMTKDGSPLGINADWLTADASAGRLVSGTLASALTAGDVVKVYANGTLLGTAAVNTAGTAWEITDTNGYSGNWNYTAQVVNSAGKGGLATIQPVNLDNTEAAPVITAVTDIYGVQLASAASTINGIGNISGTGKAGDTVYLYDNTSSNVVGSASVATDGTWTVSGSQVHGGANTFSAKQVDALGNLSVYSNTWTVTTGGGSQVVNGDFSSGNTGFTSAATYLAGGTYSQVFGASTNTYSVFSAVPDPTVVALSANANYGTSAGNASGAMTYQINYGWSGTASEFQNPGGNFKGSYFGFNSNSAYGTFWSETVNVVAGQTYNFSLDYMNWNHNIRMYVGNSYVDLWGTGAGANTSGATTDYLYAHGWGTYTATTTGTLTLEMRNVNGYADFAFDNLYFGQANNAPATDGTLVAGGTSPATSGVDGVAGTNNGAVLTYSGGVVDMLGGNDVLNAPTNVQSLLSSGGFIKGGAGVDTLKLAPNTTLNLETLTGNQTVKPIQEVEVFEMQGSSSLTLSANDVLSLGGSNASTMSAYSFASTTGGMASASSTGKVQMVINGTISDALKLKTLAQDGITTNGLQGNTGLGGDWLDMGTATIGSTSYHVYNHSTSNAQVLSTLTASTESAIVAFTSMTKDSGLAGTGATADWHTADGSTGRLISGILAEPLPAGGSVKIYANGTLLGNATVNAAGTAWEYTDTAGYSANWAYRADVVTSSGTIASAVQPVYLVVDPAITNVVVDTFTTSATTENFSSYTAGSTVGPSFTITGRNGGIAGYGGSGATFNNVNDLLGGGMAIQFGNPQNQNTAAVGEVLITKNTGDMYSISFLYGDLQFGAKTVKLYAADGTVVNTFSIANGGGTFSSGIQTRAFTSIGISGGNQDFWIMDNFNFAVASATAGGQVNLAANSTFFDTTPVLQGTTGRALTAGETIHIFDGATDLGAATVTGTNWTFNTTMATGSTKTYTASIVSASGQVLQTSNGFTATQSPSSSWAPTSNLPTGVADTVTYSGSTLDALGGNDTITAATDVQATLAAGGFINGGTGVDTLKLAAGTTLDVTALTQNQTVKSIQQIEVFELQGTSTLTLSANDVLSLGQTDAFSGTAGKVQLLVKGTASDHVALQNLLSDSVGGNSGLAGMWTKETSTVTVSSASYNVYTHSTTGAQVLISAAIPDANVSVSASPLVLDLNGDGVQTLNQDRGTQFDLLNSGAKQSVGWVDKHDGLLVMDLNHDGMVNNGSELLGTSTRLADGSLARDGWQALAQYDANADGVIDAKDAAFADLKVWVDANSDGVTEAGELKTLADVGVQAIQLQHDNAQTTQNGNVLQGFSSFVTTDGQSHQIVDAWLQTSTPAAEAVTFNLVNAKADTLNLNLSDVLKTAANTAGQHVVQVTGDASDIVNLSNLLDTGAAQGSWQASGSVVQGGVTYNAYSHSADASLQVLIDQHITQVHAA